MPGPKSGTPGELVSPATPRAADPADTADPGEVEKTKARQVALATGKYGQVPVKAHKAGGSDEDAGLKTSWIELVLIDKLDRPVAGEPYRITLADGTVNDGTTDEKGFARIDGIEPGSCDITFPELDGRSWEPA